ncbi:MAG TPA: hypothetical protein VGD59_09715 [Acidisarcina sp.]
MDPSGNLNVELHKGDYLEWKLSPGQKYPFYVVFVGDKPCAKRWYKIKAGAVTRCRVRVQTGTYFYKITADEPETVPEKIFVENMNPCPPGCIVKIKGSPHARETAASTSAGQPTVNVAEVQASAVAATEYDVDCSSGTASVPAIPAKANQSLFWGEFGNHIIHVVNLQDICTESNGNKNFYLTEGQTCTIKTLTEYPATLYYRVKLIGELKPENGGCMDSPKLALKIEKP